MTRVTSKASTKLAMREENRWRTQPRPPGPMGPSRPEGGLRQNSPIWYYTSTIAYQYHARDPRQSGLPVGQGRTALERAACRRLPARWLRRGAAGLRLRPAPPVRGGRATAERARRSLPPEQAGHDDAGRDARGPAADRATPRSGRRAGRTRVPDAPRPAVPGDGRACPRDPRSACRAAALARSAGRAAGHGQDPHDAGRRAARQQRRWDMRADTQTITIEANQSKVFRFVSNTENLPHWARAFCQAIRPDGDAWLVPSPQGEVRVLYRTGEARGDSDFHLSPAAGGEALAAARVLPRGQGAACVFTQFQTPGMPDDVFTGQVHALREELLILKALLEGRTVEAAPSCAPVR